MTDWYGWNLVDYRGAGAPARPEDVGILMISEGEPGAADKLRHATKKMATSTYTPAGGWESLEEFLSEMNRIERHAELAPTEGPKCVIWNSDRLWWPPTSPTLQIRHPTTGPNAGSLILEGIERSFRDRILQFSEYRDMT